MPKSNAERQRAFKEKHKTDDKYKQSRKTIVKKYKDRIKKEESPAAATLRKALEAKRKRDSRKAKSQQAQDQVEDAEDNSKVSPSVIGKVYKKIEKVMPKKIPVRMAVLQKIAKTLGAEFRAPSPSITRNRINVETLKNVLEFFECDEISRVDPGRKTATVKRSANPNGNQIKARRHLLFTISEAFSLYQERYPEDKIGRSKFASLRPSYVKPYQDIPHNVCVCRYHEDFESVRRIVSEYVDGFKSSSDEFVKSIVCDTDDKNCMNSSCNDCSVRITALFADAAINEIDKEVKYRQWKTVNKRYESVLVEESLSDALEELHSQLPRFLVHCFNKRRSQKAFNDAKDNVTSESILLQVDFAENYTCHYQDEIQSAHWSNPQVAVFTGVVWFGDHGQCESYAIVCDDINHDRYCVDLFLRRIIDSHIKKYPGVKSITIFSDGAASQFKQRYNFANLTILKADFKLNRLVWVFFPTSHGKGAVDGIGAVVKRFVWNTVRSKEGSIVRNAETFAALCSNLATNVLYVSVNEVQSSKVRLDQLWDGVSSIKGTLKIHQVSAVSLYVIKYSFHAMTPDESAVRVHLKADDTAMDEGEEEEEEKEEEEEEEPVNGTIVEENLPAIGQWVAVIYEGFQWVPGVIESTNGDYVDVKFMSSVGANRFSWPKKDDIDTIKYSSILTVLTTAPNLVAFSRHGVYTLPGEEYTRILDLYISTL